jgi:2-alkyl-3-oxoalkanoate reductase
MHLRNRRSDAGSSTASGPVVLLNASTTEIVEVAVIGGSGFFGRELVKALAGTSSHAVRSVDICEPTDPIEGVEYIHCDVTDREALQVALEGCQLVFHTSAVIDLSPFPARPVAGRPKIETVNIGGTQNVIDCCSSLGVERLVYTSTGDVIFNGQPKRGVDESEPYAPLPSIYNHYISSKACAEQLVLAADSGDSGLRTVALRPGEHGLGGSSVHVVPVLIPFAMCLARELLLITISLPPFRACSGRSYLRPR